MGGLHKTWTQIERERFSHPVFRLFQSELEAVYEEKNRTLDNAENRLFEAVEKKLSADLWRRMRETDDPLLKGPVPSPRYRQAMQQ